MYRCVIILRGDLVPRPWVTGVANPQDYRFKFVVSMGVTIIIEFCTDRGPLCIGDGMHGVIDNLVEVGLGRIVIVTNQLGIGARENDYDSIVGK